MLEEGGVMGAASEPLEPLTIARPTRNAMQGQWPAAGRCIVIAGWLVLIDADPALRCRASQPQERFLIGFESADVRGHRFFLGTRPEVAFGILLAGLNHRS